MYEPLQREALAFLRKESLDLFNRLHSISEDVEFVNQVHAAYPEVPILPNLRCGAWYTDPSIATDCPAYFKSTDGHFSNWSFNLRRPNLHLLPLIVAHEGTGIILVDSTRAGKRIPDALSKTLPIWCAVVNRAVLQVHPGKARWDTNLYTPPGAVSSQEHDQIEKRIDGWATALANSSYDLPDLRLPLRPMWITPASSSFPVISPEDRAFVPILCLSASRQVQDGIERRAAGFSYIQGSGDDHELWGLGLTPDMFWSHRAAILAASRSALPALVTYIVGAQSRPHVGKRATPIAKVHGCISVCATSDLPTDPRDWEQSVGYVVAGVAPPVKLPDASSILWIEAWEGKKGQMQFLQDILPRSTSFIHAQLLAGRRVCVACDTGTDFSIGIALVALQKFFDDAGEFILDCAQAADANKHSIRTRLEWIITSRPEANPSRTTLKRVNEFLLSPSSLRAPPSKPFPSRLSADESS
ncbi:initiator tRNA phosphoribosyl transferase [Mycena belliarum]|uniref:Initiator tRNA phosphoribosyl transferase n=1 Tax=Mycena belliarum TaxID=1033014 RepID=A0AAD6UHR4_9AGAR|nr:initiator tRNA phosphoribosyl transferase [Mycena belliae]